MRRLSLLRPGKVAPVALALEGKNIFLKEGLMAEMEVMEAVYISKSTVV
jgi:hypothetical protein